jgi:hypothetical protein
MHVSKQKKKQQQSKEEEEDLGYSYQYQEYDYTLKNERTQEVMKSVTSADIESMWSKAPPTAIRDLWKRYQSKPIDQGVWQAHAKDPLRDLTG